MASKLLKLPKRYSPLSRVPGKKPVGAVEIDWGVLARLGIAGNLQHYFYPVNGGFIDLVSHKHPEDTGVGWTAVGTTHGQLSFAGTDSVKYSYTDVSFEGYTAITAITQQIYNNTSGTQSVWRHDGSFTALQSASSGGIRSIFWNPSLKILSSNVAPVVGKLLTVSTSWPHDSGIAKIYVDSVEEGSSNFGTGALASTTKDFSIGGTEGGAEDFNGGLGVGIFFDTVLPDAIRLSIEANPYQLLKSTRDPYHIVPAAAPSSSKVLKLPKRYHHDFRVHGKKPVGNVEVDKANRHNDKLLDFIPITASTGAGTRDFNLARNEFTGVFDADIDREPEFIHKTTTATTGVDLVDTTIAGDFTITFRAKKIASSNSSDGMLLGYSTTNRIWLYQNTTFSFTANGSSVDWAGSGLPDFREKVRTYTLTRTGSTLDLIVSGISYGQRTHSGAFRYDSLFDFYGNFESAMELHYLHITEKHTNPSAVIKLHADLYQTLKSSNDPYYIVPASGVTPLIVLDAISTGILDTTTITTTRNLTVVDNTSTGANDTVVVTVDHNLTLLDAISTGVIDSVSVTTTGNLVTLDATSIGALDTLGVTVDHNLTLLDAISIGFIDPTTITLDQNLVVVEAVSTPSVDTTTVTTTRNLTVLDATSTGNLDTVLVNIEGTLVLVDNTSTGFIDTIALSTSGDLVLLDISSTGEVIPIGITTTRNLTVLDIESTGVVDNTAITTSRFLVVGDLNSTGSIDTTAITAQLNLVVSDAISTGVIDEVSLTSVVLAAVKQLDVFTSIISIDVLTNA